MHPLNPSYFGLLALPTTAKPDFNLVSGRLPDPSDPDEVVASYTLEQDEGVHLGSVIRVPFYAQSQQSAYDSATGAPPVPKGPAVALRVVGFEATEFDFLPAPPPSTTSTPLKASSAPCCHGRRPATCTSSASAAAPPTFPDSTLPAAPPGRFTRRMRMRRSHRSKRRSTPRPSGGGCWRRWPRWWGWPSSARRWVARASPRARTSLRWLPSGSSAVSWSCSGTGATWWSDWSERSVPWWSPPSSPRSPHSARRGSPRARPGSNSTRSC